MSDTSGNLLAVHVTAADALDREGLEEILAYHKRFLPRLRLIWVDGGYQAPDWIATIQRKFQITIEVVKRSDDMKGFVVLPRRWVIERTLAWLGRYRRLSKDYEYLPAISAGFIYLASIRRYLHLLTQPAINAT